MRYLRQSTNVHVVIGPIVDWQDGVTPKTTMTLANITCGLIKGTTRSSITLAASGDNQFTHITNGNGYWELDLTGDNLDTLGSLIVTLTDNDVFVPIWAEFMVMPANVWDSLFASDRLQVDVRELGDANLALTTQMKADVDAEVDEALATTTIATLNPTAGTLADYINKLLKVAKNKTVVTSANGGTMTVYDTDDTTPLFTFKIYNASDVRATQNIYRRDREGT